MDDEPEAPVYLTASKIIVYAMYVWVWFGIIVLAIRVFLLAFSANPDAPFVDFIYRTSAGFLQPFRGIFPPQPVSMTASLDIAALFAMIIYGLLGWGFAALLHYLQSRIDAYRQTVKRQAERQREAATRQRELVISERRGPGSARPPKPPKVQ